MNVSESYSSSVAITLPLDNHIAQSADVLLGRRSSGIPPGCLPSSENESSRDVIPPDQLVMAAQAGCELAFGKLWNLYSSRIYKTIVKITKNPEDAEDAMQEAFLHAFRSLPRFEGRARFSTWLTRIAVNEALGIQRRRRCRVDSLLRPFYDRDDEDVTEEFLDQALDPEEAYERRQRREKLMDAIADLPSNLREAVETCLTEECSLKELACKLKISEPAVKARLHRARKQLTLLTVALRVDNTRRLTGNA